MWQWVKWDPCCQASTLVVSAQGQQPCMHACTGRERPSQAQDFLTFWECFALFDLLLCGRALNCALSGQQEEVLYVWGVGGWVGWGLGVWNPSCLAHLQGLQSDYDLFTLPTVSPAQIIIKAFSHYGNKNTAMELAKVQPGH